MPYVFPIPDLLPQDLVADIRRKLDAAGDAWKDGKLTAGRDSHKKRNEELDTAGKLRQEISDAIKAALADMRRPEALMFNFLASPAKIGDFLVSRTPVGGGYGDHMDNNILNKGTAKEMRSDLSMTIFLSDPATYQGGELVIDSDMAFAPSFRMPPGGAVLYATNAIHRVNPVQSGERLVAITWIESAIADPFMRQINADLLLCLNAIAQNGAKFPELASFLTLKLEKVRGNLQKRGAA